MRALRTFRLQRNLTQAELADLAGITQPEVSNIERGIFNPSDGLLARIAAALGVSPAMELLRPVSEEPVR